MVQSVQSGYTSDSKAKEMVHPEADPERDQRTVYVSEIPLRATKEDVKKFFSSVCRVRDIELVLDPHRLEKAVGYIEFDHPKYVSRAIDLSGQLLLGEPINIEPVNARDPSTGESDSKAKEVVDPESDLERDQRTVYVSGIPWWATWEDVYKFFSSECKVRDIEIVLDGRKKAVGYIEFDHPKYVSMAIDLSGRLLLGKPINIEPVNAGDPSTGERSHTQTGINNRLDKPLHLMTSAELARDKAHVVEAAQSSPVLTPALPQHTLFSPVTMQQETSNQILPWNSSQQFLPPQVWPQQFILQVWPQQYQQHMWPQQYQQHMWPQQYQQHMWPQQYQQHVWPQQ